jgi:hypothetical protein
MGTHNVRTNVCMEKINVCKENELMEKINLCKENECMEKINLCKENKRQLSEAFTFYLCNCFLQVDIVTIMHNFILLCVLRNTLYIERNDIFAVVVCTYLCTYLCVSNISYMSL